MTAAPTIAGVGRLIWLSPYTRAPKPTAASPALGQSMGVVPVSPTFRSPRLPSRPIATAMGSTTRKIQRQLRNCRTIPETAGPSAGATDMARLTMPITRPRSSGLTTLMRVVMSSGIITAVAEAWTTRATTSTGKPHETAASSVPTENVAMASRNA